MSVELYVSVQFVIADGAFQREKGLTRCEDQDKRTADWTVSEYVFESNEPCQTTQCSDYATGLDSLQRQEFLSFSEGPTAALTSAWLQKAVSPEIIRPGSEAGHAASFAFT